jgi:GT2 family glycosyltransferase
MAYRAKKHGLRVVYMPDSVLVHMENASTDGLSNKFYYYYHKSRLRFVFKNYSFRGIRNRFLSAEIKWFFNELPPDIRTTLLKVYLVSLPVAAAILIKRIMHKGINKR